jgi:hypothetical protein
MIGTFFNIMVPAIDKISTTIIRRIIIHTTVPLTGVIPNTLYIRFIKKG